VNRTIIFLIGSFQIYKKKLKVKLQI